MIYIQSPPETRTFVSRFCHFLHFPDGEGLIKFSEDVTVSGGVIMETHESFFTNILEHIPGSLVIML